MQDTARGNMKCSVVASCLLFSVYGERAVMMIINSRSHAPIYSIPDVWWIGVFLVFVVTPLF